MSDAGIVLEEDTIYTTGDEALLKSYTGKEKYLAQMKKDEAQQEENLFKRNQKHSRSQRGYHS